MTKWGHEKFIKFSQFSHKKGMEYKPTAAIIYTELNEHIELVSEWMYFILVRIYVAGIILPLFVLSAVNYFILDLGEQSFLLSWPIL